MAFRYLHVSTNSFIQVAFLLNSAGPWQYLFLFGERKANNFENMKHFGCCGPGLGGQYCGTGRILKIILMNYKKRDFSKSILCFLCGSLYVHTHMHAHTYTQRLYSRSLLCQEIELRE